MEAEIRHARGREREAGGAHTVGLGDGGMAKDGKRLQKLEKARKRLPCGASRRNTVLPAPEFQSRETQVGLRTSRIMRC